MFVLHVDLFADSLFAPFWVEGDHLNFYNFLKCRYSLSKIQPVKRKIGKKKLPNGCEKEIEMKLRNVPPILRPDNLDGSFLLQISI